MHHRLMEPIMTPTTASLASPDVSIVVSILAKYARGACEQVDDGTTLRSLDIDRLDLAMIALDIEDKFEVEFPERMLRRRAFENIAAIRTAIVELTAGR